MGLSDGTPIVTSAEVKEITHEALLENLDGDASATLANACKWATTWLMDELDSRGIPVAKIANPERLKRAAAFASAANAIHGSRLGEEADKRADDYLAKATDALSKYRFVSSDAPGPGTTNLLLPEVGNQEARAVFGPTSAHLFPFAPPPFLQ